MIWNKEKLRKSDGKIPPHLFSDESICPVCSRKINPKDEKFDATGMNPYLRFFNKFYWIHKECFFVVYEGMDETVKQNRDEHMVEEL